MPDRGNSTVIKRKQHILEALARMLEETRYTDNHGKACCHRRRFRSSALQTLSL